MSFSVPSHLRKNDVFMTSAWSVICPESHNPAMPKMLRNVPVVGAMKSTMRLLGTSDMLLAWLEATE
jgi:hypothetical protein